MSVRTVDFARLFSYACLSPSQFTSPLKLMNFQFFRFSELLFREWKVASVANSRYYNTRLTINV